MLATPPPPPTTNFCTELKALDHPDMNERNMQIERNKTEDKIGKDRLASAHFQHALQNRLPSPIETHVSQPVQYRIQCTFNRHYTQNQFKNGSV